MTNVRLPEKVKIVGDGAFHICSGLKSVTMGNAVETIGHDAFHGCINLTEITLSGSVTKIGLSAFYYCTKLEIIHFGGSKEQWLAIAKGATWNYAMGAAKVECTDGTILP